MANHICYLSFSEYMTAFEGSMQKGLQQYMVYGGLPQIFDFVTDEEKSQFLAGLFDETYIRDIKRYYIQSAYSMPTPDKVEQEEASLRKVDDFFKRIVVTGDETPITRNNYGITTMSIYDFLLNDNSLEM